MMSDDDFQISDSEVDESKHAEIITNVLNLNKPQRLKKSFRSEPTLQISEFNLVKSSTSHQSSVKVDNLARALKGQKKYVKLGDKIKLAKKNTHTLPKPLEKNQTERIKRSVSYEKTRYLFDRWEAFVTSNRAQAHRVFPLDRVESIKVKNKQAENFTTTWTFKSELQKELDKLKPEVEEYHIEDEQEKNGFPLTLQELKEKRKEEAKLRAHQRFKEEKVRKQNKIKSKKYHRILRKEKIKQKLKEFEELQKSNPEQALKKLKEIDNARALERYNLRHKSTGQWARSRQVRAKYDKESRQVLAQQLQVSRDLTQKQKHLSSDSEDEVLDAEESLKPSIADGENPWLTDKKLDREITEFISDYKKFQLEQVKEMKLDQPKVDSKRTENESRPLKNQNNFQEVISERRIPLKQDSLQTSVKKKTKKRKSSDIKDPVKTIVKNTSKIDSFDSSRDPDVEEIFDKTERKLENELKKKLLKNKKLQKSGEIGKKLNKSSKKNNIEKKSKKSNLDIPLRNKKQIIDEEMLESPFHREKNAGTNDISVLKNTLSAEPQSSSNNLGSSTDIDPENFMKPKVSKLGSAFPDLTVEDENTEENSQKSIIIQAFEDNDITEEFSKEKQELNKDETQSINLNLPGWGSWSGAGINPKKQRKRRRFIVKMPEVLPRSDANRGSLIINEKAINKIKPHLVTEVPFPFKTVKDYEASIRAPIGNTFVPELAYRKLIRPTVETKMGCIIEPATLSFLMGKPSK